MPVFSGSEVALMSKTRPTSILLIIDTLFNEFAGRNVLS